MASEEKIESTSEKKTESVSEKKIESGTQKVTEVISEKKTETVSGTPIKSESKNKTDLLDPLTAVRLVWAMTDGFGTSRLLKKKEEADAKESDTHPSQIIYYNDVNANEANILLSKIVTESEKHSQEREYVEKAVIAMRAALRNLGTIYSGRELNFKENDALREAYIASITASIEHGNAFRDYTKELPATVIASLAGLGVSYLFKEVMGFSFEAFDYFLIIILFGAFGFLLSWMIMKLGYYRQFEGMIQQEHERIIYFEQYLYRVHRQLQELFNELDTIHKDVFGKPSEQKGEEAIKNLIGNLYPTACKNLIYCARNEGTNKDTWAWCETGVSETCLELYKPPEIMDPNNREDLEKLKKCPHWKKESPLKSLGIPIALLSVMIIAIIILVLSVNPAPDVVLEKTSSLQELEMNQSLNVSLALTNKGIDSITDITIRDEVPSEGFILTDGNTTRNEEFLEQGKTIFMNYSLKALKAGSYDLKPAKASYTLNGSSYMVSSKSITINVNEEGNTSLSQGASVITPNSTPG